MFPQHIFPLNFQNICRQNHKEVSTEQLFSLSASVLSSSFTNLMPLVLHQSRERERETGAEMESDDEVLLSSSPSGASPPVRERKLKRLKKAIRDSEDPKAERSDDGPLMAEEKFSESETLKFGESDEPLLSGSGSEEIDVGNALDSGFTGIDGEEKGSGAKRALNFDALGEEANENGEDRSKEIGEESVDIRMEELEKKRLSPDRLEEEKDKEKKKKNNNKKRKKRIEGSDDDEKSKENKADKRISERERRDYLKQLHAESQRLLRETRDASFKPVPLVQKPISSVLEKIRRRKLEVSKKSMSITSTSFIDYDGDDDDFSREVIVDRTTEVACVDEREDSRVSGTSCKEAIARPTEAEGSIDVLNRDESNDSATHSEEKVPQVAVDEEPRPSCRAPIDDTQEFFSDSQTSDSKNEAPSSPLEEAFVPSELVMNLQLDSAPPDDVSSDEEDNDKENVDPQPCGSADLSLSPKGDPVKAFVDDEAEEEDDSDNDLLRFKENEEDEDDEDLEELKEMIATGYEEKPIDSERRNELHQQWLEQQDAAGTENLLQKLKYGSKVKQTAFVEEEEEDKEANEDDKSGDEDAEELAPSNLVKMNLRKVKQMIPQMFTDNNDAYLSDDEETDERITKQCLLEKAEEHVSFLSPAEDESSREVFGLIKKLNTMPDAKKRAKTHTYFDMSLMGVNRNMSSKPSFLGRGSSHCLPSSRKGSITARSFIFERDDSNSRSALSASEDSSEAIQRENRPRTTSVKFSNSQAKTLTQNSSSLMTSDTSLFDILKRTSLTSKRCTVDNMVTVTQTESILASFKLANKPAKPKEDRHL